MVVRHVTNEMRAKTNRKLLSKQVNFLEDFLEVGRKRAFEDILGRKQSRFSSDFITNEWEFVRYENAGSNWRNESGLFCECGRKLRYQYILRHKTTGLKKSFGLNHLTEHTGIQPEFARLIVKELAQLERERNEIVEKWVNDWTLESAGINYVPSPDEVPEDILKHLSYDMPLLERQIKKLKKIIQAEKRLAEEKQLQRIVAAEKKKLEEKGHL